VRLLLENGADIEARDSDYGRTPLSWAAERGSAAVVKLLLKKGADIEATDNYCRTPLSWAAERGEEAVVKLLLEKGADVKAMDNKYGHPPRSLAAERGYEVFKLQGSGIYREFFR
jgi:ankyrin repeat protein